MEVKNIRITNHDLWLQRTMVTKVCKLPFYTFNFLHKKTNLENLYRNCIQLIALFYKNYATT